MFLGLASNHRPVHAWVRYPSPCVRLSVLSHLRCPATGSPLVVSSSAAQWATGDPDRRSLTRGWLVAADGGAAYPVLRGFVVFDDALSALPDDAKAALDSLEARLFASRAEFADFVHHKVRRPAFDVYAAWQPFNEASRALDPLLAVLSDVVPDGALIVDLWCRTGWSGERLARRFPQATVIAMLDSGRDVLGSRGLDYWLPPHARAPNLEFVFASPGQRLPFADGIAALVHGFDVLHSAPHVVLVPEVMRVARADGAVVFPHVHLSNAEPDPWFDRGGVQLHGTQYADVFGKHLQGDKRRCWVLSEKTMLGVAVGGHGVLRDESEMTHYNGCVLVGPSRWDGATLGGEQRESGDRSDARIIAHPMVRVDLASGRCTLDGGRFDGRAGWLLARHGISETHLQATLPYTMTLTERQVHFHGRAGRTAGDIAARLGLTLAVVQACLATMARNEVVRACAVGGSMARLQAYYATQAPPRAPQSCTLTDLLLEADARHGERPYLVWPADDSTFSYADTLAIARQGATLLQRAGVGPGDAVVLEAVGRPEFALLMWAVVLAGGVVVPLDPNLGPERFARLVQRVNAKVVVVASAGREAVLGEGVLGESGARPLVLGIGAAAELGVTDAVAALAEAEPQAEPQPVRPEDPAAILFTSGSTGEPKGVVLPHRSLVLSSLIVDRLYALTPDDRLMMAGGFHTMSGFRNPFIAPLHAGATTVLPRVQRSSPLATLDEIVASGVTVLGTVPAFIGYALAAADKAARLFKRSRLRTVLCTGAALDGQQAAAFTERFNIPIRDYYGLTETGGMCIARDETDGEGLGRPRGALVGIVGRDGQPVGPGEVGEIAVHSDQLMLGYLDEPRRTADTLRDGWLFTGDRGRVTGDGDVIWLGRNDRLIIDRDGENLQPEEIERALLATHTVRAARVLSVDGGDGVPRLMAAVELTREVQPTPAVWEGLSTALAKALSPRHVPARFFALDAMPRTSAGKIDETAIITHVTAALTQGPS